MKKFLLIFMTLAMFSLTGCSETQNNSDTMDIIPSDRFKMISHSEAYDERIYVDTETNVEYAVIHIQSGYETGMSVLLNADGTPMIYQGD